MSVENLVRDNSILDINSELEFLHRFDNVPASMACTTQSIDKDIIKNQIWDICKTTGLIQLRELLPLDVVYMFPHNDAIGKDWNLHNVNFVNFLKKCFSVASTSYHPKFSMLYFSIKIFFLKF